jgi:hypothetical protein
VLVASTIVAKDGTPLLSQIRTAVPFLNKVSADLPRFVNAAKPGLKTLGAAIKTAIPAIRDATPVLGTVRTYLHRSLPETRLFATLASNLQQHGFIENFLNVAYEIGAALAREDATSHMLGILLVGPNNGLCSSFATKPVAGCSAHFGSQPSYTPVKAIARSTGHRAAAKSAARSGTTSSSLSASGAPATPASGTTSTPAQPGATGALPAVTGAAVQQTTQALKNLVNYLLK